MQNLKRSAGSLRNQLAQRNGQTASGVMNGVMVGEADKGLDFDGRLAVAERLFPTGNGGPPMSLTQEQTAFLGALERAEVLRGRVKAYELHNDSLEAEAKQLKSKSVELEERYKKMVSLCTKVEVENVDGVLDGLLQAVVSEQKENVELGRVRDFLRMVEG